MHWIGHQKNPGEASFGSVYANYRNNAKLRNLDFILTKDEFKKIVIGNCFYCGAAPKSFNAYKRKKTVSQNAIDRAWIKINGIDRTNNSVGYTPENCVACCETCNWMKSNLNKKEFFDHILKIYQNYLERNDDESTNQIQ